MIRYVLVSALLISGASEAQSPKNVQPPDTGYVWFAGGASCGDWYAARRGEGKYSWEGDVSWFRGFISGHNAYATPPETRAIMAEPNDVALWLDTYCAKNPTMLVANGAVAYIEAHGGSNPFPGAKGK